MFVSDEVRVCNLGGSYYEQSLCPASRGVEMARVCVANKENRAEVIVVNFILGID